MSSKNYSLLTVHGMHKTYTLLQKKAHSKATKDTNENAETSIIELLKGKLCRET